MQRWLRGSFFSYLAVNLYEIDSDEKAVAGHLYCGCFIFCYLLIPAPNVLFAPGQLSNWAKNLQGV